MVTDIDPRVIGIYVSIKNESRSKRAIHGAVEYPVTVI